MDDLQHAMQQFAADMRDEHLESPFYLDQQWQQLLRRYIAEDENGPLNDATRRAFADLFYAWTAIRHRLIYGDLA